MGSGWLPHEGPRGDRCQVEPLSKVWLQLLGSPEGLFWEGSQGRPGKPVSAWAGELEGQQWDLIGEGWQGCGEGHGLLLLAPGPISEAQEWVKACSMV